MSRGAAPLEAGMLLARAAAVRREWLMAHPEACPSASVARRYSAMVRRRAEDRVPVAYLTGEKEFAGLRFAMRRGVFIPRPETEGLLELVEDWLRPRLPLGPGSVVVDSCTGSGVLGASLARRLGVHVVATDRSRIAVTLARDNARRLGAGGLVRVLAGDLLAPLGTMHPAPRVVAVVSNPPYVNAPLMRRLPPEIRDHEPPAALAGGRDGLAVIARLLSQAARWMAPGGLMAVEIGAEQRRGILALLARGPWLGVRVERDLAGRVRYALATRKTQQ